jgi:hypothetical protein
MSVAVDPAHSGCRSMLLAESSPVRRVHVAGWQFTGARRRVGDDDGCILEPRRQTDCHYAVRWIPAQSGVPSSEGGSSGLYQKTVALSVPVASRAQPGIRPASR